MTNVTNNTFQLKAYSIGELAKMYNVNWRTFKKWIEPFNTEIGSTAAKFNVPSACGTPMKFGDVAVVVY